MATAAEGSAENRRRRYWIDKAFQAKYVAVFVVFIASLGVAGLLILVLGSGDAAGREAPGLRRAILALLGLTAVFTVLTIRLGVRYSHRMVGPIRAISRHLEWARDGSYTRDLTLRDKDEFRGIETAFNQMQTALRQRAREDAAALAGAESRLRQLAQALESTDGDREAARELVRLLHQDLEAIRVRCEGHLTP